MSTNPMMAHRGTSIILGSKGNLTRYKFGHDGEIHPQGRGGPEMLLSKSRVKDKVADRATCLTRGPFTSRELGHFETSTQFIKGTHRDGEIYECMVSKSGPVNQCASSYPMECLATEIPWYTTPKRVKECFACCLGFWMDHLNLAEKYNDIHTVNFTPFPIKSPAWRIAGVRHIGPDDVLFDAWSFHKLAAALPKGFLVASYEWQNFDSQIDRVWINKTVAWANLGFKRIEIENKWVKDHDILVLGNNFNAPLNRLSSFPTVLDRIDVLPRGIHNISSGWQHVKIWDPIEVPRSDNDINCCCMQLRKEAHNRHDKYMALVGNGMCQRWQPYGEITTDKIVGDRYVEQLAAHQYQFSPWGIGPLNFRDHESVVAGTIPLFDDEPDIAEGGASRDYTPRLYAQAPVLWIPEWKNVTMECVQDAYRRMYLDFKAGTHRWQLTKFYMPYWIFRILDKAKADFPEWEKYLRTGVP
uniref:Uncharacterized protein n=1 Tax=Octactis speculum TaxID=3111310 RepID=A0A7S2MEZ7_9STRA